MEPQNFAVVAKDRILRFGGSCSQDLEWPADNSKTSENEEEEKMPPKVGYPGGQKGKQGGCFRNTTVFYVFF